jgi:hypothetical protein
MSMPMGYPPMFNPAVGAPPFRPPLMIPGSLPMGMPPMGMPPMGMPPMGMPRGVPGMMSGYPPGMQMGHMQMPGGIPPGAAMPTVAHVAAAQPATLNDPNNDVKSWSEHEGDDGRTYWHNSATKVKKYDLLLPLLIYFAHRKAPMTNLSV